MNGGDKTYKFGVLTKFTVTITFVERERETLFTTAPKERTAHHSLRNGDQISSRVLNGIEKWTCHGV